MASLRFLVLWVGALRGGAAVLVACMALVGAPGESAAADPVPPKSFASAGGAGAALIAALAKDDGAALLEILGSGAADILSSGDPVADAAARKQLLQAVGEKAQVEEAGADRAILHVGANDWPLPIPIVKRGDAWVFDVEQGKDEILARRIGRNELNAIAVCHGYVAAQRAYATVDREGDGVVKYARQILSDDGRRNGLYWPVAEGEAPSPFGPLVAEAADEGYGKASAGAQPAPYRGYIFRILERQGAHAPGGAYDYVINGNMVAGFALVAYPADYGNSGIMTFVVNQLGRVLEKDLGAETASLAHQMSAYDPDDSWLAAE
ncbi:MAG: DUF2950 family protein [Azospirillum sp.]|nr:DUF2950 family protein [Azospirillum sp.]